MAVLKNIYQGESFTIGLRFNPEYDISNLQSLRLFLNNDEYFLTQVGEYYRCELSSDDTKTYNGQVQLICVVDDIYFGIKKSTFMKDYLNFLPSRDNFSDESINTGYDIELIINIDTSLLSTDLQLVEAIKGQSAYQSAILGGFTGNEEDFNNRLAILGNTVSLSGSNTFIGNQIISGNLEVIDGIIGDLNGTSSYSEQSISASNATLLNGYDENTLPLSNPVSSSIDEKRKLLHCGPITDVVVTDLGNGLINLSSIQVNLNNQEDFTGDINTYIIPALNNIQLIANQYTYITVQYNDGNPQYVTTTDNNIINHSTILNIVQLYWENIDLINKIHIFYTGTYGLGLSNKIGHRLLHTERFGYESGLILGEYGNRNISISAGKLWYDGEEIDTLAVNTATTGHETHFYYPVAGVLTATKVTQYPNTQYSNGTNLANLTGNKYTSVFVWKCVNSTDRCSYIMLGGEYQSIADALATPLPSIIPDVIVKQAKYIGRIIIKNGQSVASQIVSELTSAVGQSPVTDHNSMSNIQGGAPDEYYHLTENEINSLKDFVTTSSFADFSSSISPRISNLETIISSSNISNMITQNGDLKIGDSTNYTEIGQNGIKLSGNATQFNDVYPSSVTIGTGVNSPSFTSYNGNLKAYEFIGSGPTIKELNMGFQIPHGYLEGSTIMPHIHVYIPNDINGGTIKFSCEYTWTDIDQTGSISPTTITGSITRLSNQGINNNAIISFGNVSGINKKISSIFMCRIYREPADNVDTFLSSVWLKSADIHIELDSIGSNVAITKN